MNTRISLSIFFLLLFCFLKSNTIIAAKSGNLKPIELSVEDTDDDKYSNTDYIYDEENVGKSGKEILGRATWGFLHTFAGMYPANPDLKYQEYVRLFINTLPYIYPCEECAVGMRAFFDSHPPEVRDLWAIMNFINVIECIYQDSVICYILLLIFLFCVLKIVDWFDGKYWSLVLYDTQHGECKIR